MGDNDRVKDVIVVTERGADQLSQIVKPPRELARTVRAEGEGQYSSTEGEGALWIIWLGLRAQILVGLLELNGSMDLGRSHIRKVQTNDHSSGETSSKIDRTISFSPNNGR